MKYSEEWFWHTLCLAIGKSVAEARNTISDVEFGRWIEYYKDFPFDDYHRHIRPASLISSMLASKASYSEFSEFLQPQQKDENFNEADMSVIKVLGG